MNETDRQMVCAALAEFGAALSDDDVIVKGEKLTGVKVATKGKRLRFDDQKTGRCQASGPIDAASVRRFVTSFWYWVPLI